MRGSHALIKCYKCTDITDETPTGRPCMDPTLKMDTCEAKEYCATIGYMCSGGIRFTHSFLVVGATVMPVSP